MRLALAHGSLLVLALLGAYRTWTREEASPQPGSVTVWKGSPVDVVALAYEAPGKSVRVERTGEGGDRVLWGRAVTVSRWPAAAGDTAATERADTAEFLVGQEGERLVEQLASPRALRDLGAVDEEHKGEYGLVEDTARVVVRFRDRARELVVGGSVYGSGDRYVLEPASGRVYVLPAQMIHTLESGELTLAERRLHTYERDDVAAVTLRAPAGERTMRRTAGESFGPGIWTPPDAPDQPDQTFANFMQRLEQLWISEYAPDLDPGSLTRVLRADYVDADGRALGFLELLKRTDPEGQSEYYLRTEVTRVLTRTYEGLAEQVDADVAQVFARPPTAGD